MKTLMISPILPRIPKIENFPSAETALIILSYTICIVFAGLTAFLVSRYAAEHFKGNKKKTALLSCPEVMELSSKTTDRCIIWSNMNLDLDEWREDMREQLEMNGTDALPVWVELNKRIMAAFEIS